MNQIDIDTLLTTIGNNLNILRNARKETLESVAKDVGITHPVLSKIENGRYPGLSISLLIRLCNHYKTTPQQVLGLEMMHIFNLSQAAESGSENNTLKQVVNDIAEGYLHALEQYKSEVKYLREMLSQLKPSK